MTTILVNLSAFLSAFLAVFAANAIMVELYSGERKRLKKRVEEQYRRQQRERARNSPLLKDFDKIAAEARAEIHGERTLLERFKFMVEQSGVETTVAKLIGISVVIAGVLGFVGYFYLGLSVGVVLAVFGFILPIAYIYAQWTQRMNRLREQLPDAFELMARVMRSGQTISQAMQSVSDEFSRPISLEFLYCYEQMNLGMPAEAALRDLGRRTGLLEMRIFVLAVVVHRQTGGNLAELLDRLAAVVRERFRIRGMIKSLTAQGRFQAAILLGLPPFMFCLLMLISRDYEMILLDHPSLIAIALGMMGLGWLWIRQIINFDY